MILVPETPEEIARAEAAYPDAPVEAAKAWPEMIHRYAAASLGLVILILFVLTVRARMPWKLPAALVALVILQGAFGAWTVTLKLWPQVVTTHLLGGFATSGPALALGARTAAPGMAGRSPRWVRCRRLALVVVVAQVALGGWVTANYAALACPDFPLCHGAWIPDMDFAAGFDIFQDVGPNYLGGLMSSDARVAIHVVHRIGAVAVLVVAGWLVWRLGRRPMAWVLGGVLGRAAWAWHRQRGFRPAARRCRAAQRGGGGIAASRRDGQLLAAPGRRTLVAMKTTLVVLLLVGLVAVGAAFVYLGPGTEFSDEELRAFGFMAYPEPRDVGEFALVDTAGAEFGPDRLRGRWTFMFFGFANCPDICPITMQVLGDAEDVLVAAGDTPFQGVLVTVDPERDTPPALAAYVGAFSDNFVGVTGSPPAIHTFARSFHVGFSKELVDDSELGYVMNHSGRIIVVDPRGRHYGSIKSPFDATRIATLYRALAAREKPP